MALMFLKNPIKIKKILSFKITSTQKKNNLHSFNKLVVCVTFFADKNKISLYHLGTSKDNQCSLGSQSGVDCRTPINSSGKYRLIYQDYLNWLK